MQSLTGFKVSFTPQWRMALLALFLIVLFMRLGFWQIQRAHEKTHMLNEHHVLSKQPPHPWSPSNKTPHQYEPLIIGGYFLPQVFLLDNQHQQHQFGYDVISPLVLANGEVILVDRGWIGGDVTRQSFPSMSKPKGQVKIKGTVYYPSAKNWLLGESLEKKQTHMAIIELVDITVISQFLHKSVYPFIIRLSPGESHGFVRNWSVVAMHPQRHYAYALQWFVMALVVLILFIALNLKKKHEKSP